MTTDPGRKPPTKAHSESQDQEDQIRARAFALYEERGREEGHDLEDWFSAQEQIKKKSASKTA